MNFVREDIDALNAVVRLQINPEDYQPILKKKVNELQRKSQLKGFRPGKAPVSLIQKMYGKQVLAEELDKLVGESLSNYLKENDLKLMGDPLPSKTQKTLDLDTDQEFEFAFDIAFLPTVELGLDKNFSVPYYDVEVSETMMNEYIDNACKRFGSYQQKDAVETGEESLRGEMVQLDENGNVLANGIKEENVLISLTVMKDEAIKAQFIGATKEQIIRFNVRTAYPNDSELSSMLKISKEKAAELNSDFNFTIKSIELFVNAELNEELFTKVHGEDVTTEELFRERTTESIKQQLSMQSDLKFLHDTKDKLMAERQINLPDEFLQRWLLTTDKNATQEVLDKEYPQLAESFRWQVLKSKMTEAGDIKIEEREILDKAIELAMPGLLGTSQFPQEQLDEFARNILKRPQDRQFIIDTVHDGKIIAYLKETISQDTKSISFDDFKALVEAKEETNA